MLSLEITPRFNDCDGLAHINNAIVLSWFESARRPIFEMFNPSLKMEDWNLIIARVEVDYLAQISYSDSIVVETSLSKVGNSSMIVEQTLLANAQPAARGKCVMVHFDFATNKSVQIPEDIRSKLSEHLVS